MIELYNRLTSTCSQKVRMCLAEKKLDYINIWIDGNKKENLTPEYLALNPNGVVPTMVHDGKVIIDSSVICEYLDEAFPEPSLAPADPVERAHMRAWMRFAEEVPTVAIRVPSFRMVLYTRFKEMDEQTFLKQEADIRPLRKHFYRRMGGARGFTDEDVSAALEELDLTLSRMEKSLAGGPWLLGKHFTLADIILVPTIDRMNDLGLHTLWEKRYPRVKAWYGLVRHRESFKKAYAPGARYSEIRAIRGIDVPLPC